MMKKRLLCVLVFVLCSTLAYGSDFTLKSASIKPGATLTDEQVFNGFGCSGKNESPALSWVGAPEGTKSFALTMYDPDAPTGSGWWHWVVYNIPEHVTSLLAGAGEPSGAKLPKGTIQGRTDFGTHAFGGACPPEGDVPHRYIFTLYALKTDKIDLPKDSSAAMIGFMIHANMIGKTSFTATYWR